MDTISRENNSMLPMAGVIVGGLGLIAGLYGAVMAGKVKAHVTDEIDPKIARIDDIANQASSASAGVTSLNTKVDGVLKGTQDAFNDVGGRIGAIQTQLQKLEDAQKSAPVAHGRHGGGGAVVAGPGEYIVKSGDSGARIARSNGVSLHDLIAVNPNVNWHKLHVGEKIKLPEKKGAADAAAPAPAANP